MWIVLSHLSTSYFLSFFHSTMGSEYKMIEKFDGENYYMWKLKIKFILIDKGLYKVASRKHKIPSGVLKRR